MTDLDVWGRLDAIQGILTGDAPSTVDVFEQQAATFPEPVPVTQPAQTNQFTDIALAQAGDAYVWGAGRGLEDDPAAFDCSGLVYFAARKLGLKVGGTAYDQWKQASKMTVEEALATPGALLFSGDGTGSGRQAITHVAISLGDGRTIEARGTRYGVMVVDADTNRRRFNYGGTIPGLNGSGLDNGSPTSAAPKTTTDSLEERMKVVDAVIRGRPIPSKVPSTTEGPAVGVDFEWDADATGAGLFNDERRNYQVYAKRQVLDRYGWDEGDYRALVDLWNRESGWNPNAQNPGSSAFGIAQFLDGTWAATGFRKTKDPYQQIDAGLAYIARRYGRPTEALVHSRDEGWY